MWSGRNGLILVMLIASGMLNYADRQIIAVLKPMLQASLHWSDSDYGRLTSIFQFASAISLLGSGWVVDRIGWRRANPLAVGGWSMAAMAHAFTRTLSQFTLARVALGGAEAFGTPAAIKTIAAVFRIEDRSLALGVVNAANTIGAIITPLIVPWLAMRVGWANAFLVTGGLGLAWVAVWFIASPGNTPAHAPRLAPNPRDRVRWSVVFSDPRTWAVAGAKALSDQVWWLLLFWMPDLFHRVFHLSMAGFGAPLAVIYGCAGVGSLIGGWAPTSLLERGVSLNVARKSTLLGAALLVTPVWLVLAVHNYWAATAILGLTLAAHQAFSVNVFALAADISPASRVATVVSLGAFCGNMAGTAILQGAGWILSAGFGYGPLLAMASVSYLLGVGWIQLLLPKIIAAPAEPETKSSDLPPGLA
jgi:ACS family hexuronate transporter-like MFS transporter